MFNLGGPEIFLLLVLALVFVGPRRMPEVGRALGRLVAEFRRATGDLRAGIEKEVDLTEVRKAGQAITQARQELGELAATPVRVLSREVAEVQAKADLQALERGAAPAGAEPRSGTAGPATAGPVELDARRLGLTSPDRPTREELARESAPEPGADPGRDPGPPEGGAA
jgi:Tat protein translocase TatB subunit